MLNGSALLVRVRERQEASKSEIVCGFGDVSTKETAGEHLNVTTIVQGNRHLFLGKAMAPSEARSAQEEE